MAHSIIFGGSSGIGAATAAAFAARGDEVVITGRDRAKLRVTAAEITGAVTYEQVDGTSATQVEQFFAGGPKIDQLVIALSGSLGAGPLESLDLAVLRQAFEAKFWAHLNIAKTALARMNPTGSILFVTAASARAAMPGTAGLAALNGALESMVPPLAAELAPVRVNAVSPGVIDTPWWTVLDDDQRRATFENFSKVIPLRRVGQAAEVAEAIVAVATNGYIAGTVIEVTGGAHLATGR